MLVARTVLRLHHVWSCCRDSLHEVTGHLLRGSRCQVPVAQLLPGVDVDELFSLLVQFRHQVRHIITLDPRNLERQPLPRNLLHHQLAYSGSITGTGIDGELDVVLLEVRETRADGADEGRVEEGIVGAVPFVQDFVGLVDCDGAF